MTWTLLEQLDRPDVEQVTYTYLTANLTGGVKAFGRPPDPKPPTFVVVQRAGGVSDGIFDDARLTFQCWGATKKQALDLAGTVRDLMFRMRGVQSGYTVNNVTEAGGPVWALDPDGNLPRYLFTMEARFRANPKGN